VLLRKKGDLKKWVQDVGIDKRGISMEEKIVTIINKMADYLNISQMKKLQEVLLQTFSKNTIQKEEISNDEYLRLFLDAKRIEGCSERTIKYYSVTVVRMLQKIETPVRKISTEEIRKYLVDYQKINDCSKVTVDNVRRNISSFFSWLEEEDYILKSPMRRIHKIKTKQPVKEIISDEAIELLRDHCQCPRDLAMIDLLYSTGIRVGELVNLNISDIDFEARECIVFGKGDKERKVYFDAKAKLHLLNYLHKRDDDNPALFVTLDAPHERLKISGVEIRIRTLGRKLNMGKIHPHKFRRTMATRAIDKGMPIEQVQKLLGHSQIDTTMQYAIVNQTNVKTSHQKFIA
jgi:integrase/recombinase XerD